MTKVDVMLFLKVWVWLMQALPNHVRSFTNSWVLSPKYPNVYRKYIQGIFNSWNLYFNLILNLPLNSSPCFNMKINEFHNKTFSNLVFGDDFDPNMTIGMYHDLFHVLETKFNPRKSILCFRMSFLSKPSVTWVVPNDIGFEFQSSSWFNIH